MKDRHVISPYPVRMPREMRDLLEESAGRGGRSLHAEIIKRLEATIAIDEYMAEIKAGTYADALTLLESVLGDNDRMTASGEQTYSTAYSILDQLLDEKLKPLREQLHELGFERQSATPSSTPEKAQPDE